MMDKFINALSILMGLDATFLIFFSTTLCLAVAGLALYVVLKVVTSQTNEEKKG